MLSGPLGMRLAVPDDADRWMTIAELAEYLQLSRAKLYAMAQTGEIPCSKVAGQWRFSRSELDAWMRQQRPQAKRDQEER